jgi:hypothetical protein
VGSFWGKSRPRRRGKWHFWTFGHQGWQSASALNRVARPLGAPRVLGSCKLHFYALPKRRISGSVGPSGPVSKKGKAAGSIHKSCISRPQPDAQSGSPQYSHSGPGNFSFGETANGTWYGARAYAYYAGDHRMYYFSAIGEAKSGTMPGTVWNIDEQVIAANCGTPEGSWTGKNLKAYMQTMP